MSGESVHIARCSNSDKVAQLKARIACALELQMEHLTLTSERGELDDEVELLAAGVGSIRQVHVIVSPKHEEAAEVGEATP